MASLDPTAPSNRSAYQVLRELVRPTTDGDRRDVLELTHEELSARTGLSRGNVHNVLKDLVGADLATIALRHTRPRTGPGGRAAAHYRLRADLGLAIGVSFHDNGVDAVIANLAGQMLWRRRVGGEEFTDHGVDEQPELALDKAADMIARGLAALEQEDRPPAAGRPGALVDRIAGVGVALSAPVSDGRASERVLAEWGRVDAGGELRSRLRRLRLDDAVPILVDNDANLAALREHAYGLGQEEPELAANMLFVKPLPGPAGLGSGLLIDGELYRGKGVAGEVAHVVIAPPEDAPDYKCPHCGRRDCLQQRLDTDWLLRGVPREKRAKFGLPAEGKVRWDALVAAAEAIRRDEVKGAPGGRVPEPVPNDLSNALDEACRTLGRGLAPVVTVVAPRVIVIGGPLGRAWSCLGGDARDPEWQLDGPPKVPPPFRLALGPDPLREQLDAYTMKDVHERVELRLGPVADPSAEGAVAAALRANAAVFVLRLLRGGAG